MNHRRLSTTKPGQFAGRSQSKNLPYVGTSNMPPSRRKKKGIVRIDPRARCYRFPTPAITRTAGWFLFLCISTGQWNCRVKYERMYIRLVRAFSSSRILMFTWMRPEGVKPAVNASKFTDLGGLSFFSPEIDNFFFRSSTTPTRRVRDN